MKEKQEGGGGGGGEIDEGRGGGERLTNDLVKRLGRTWMREARGERYMAFRSGGLRPVVDGQSLVEV